MGGSRCDARDRIPEVDGIIQTSRELKRENAGAAEPFRRRRATGCTMPTPRTARWGCVPSYACRGLVHTTRKTTNTPYNAMRGYAYAEQSAKRAVQRRSW